MKTKYTYRRTKYVRPPNSSNPKSNKKHQNDQPIRIHLITKQFLRNFNCQVEGNQLEKEFWKKGVVLENALLCLFWRLVIKCMKSNEERNERCTLESFYGNYGNLDGSSKNHRFQLYVSQSEHGVMILATIKMDLVVRTFGMPYSVKKNSLSFLLLPRGQLYPIVWFSTRIFLLPGYYPFPCFPLVQSVVGNQGGFWEHTHEVAWEKSWFWPLRELLDRPKR